MNTFDIRLARLIDARKIAAISRDHIEYGLGWHYQEAEIRREIGDEDTNVIVAERGDAFAGFAIMRYAGFEAHLVLFGVIPAFRRQGAGAALLRWLIRTAEVAGAQTIFVELRKTNSTARRFYRSIGFKSLEDLDMYYSGREDGLRMALDLRRPPDPP